MIVSSLSSFCRNHIQIVGQRDKAPFRLYPYQERLLQTCEDNTHVAASKFRQGGFTRTAEVYGLWHCLFDIDQHVVFVVNSDRTARNENHVVQEMIQGLPANIRPRLGIVNDHRIAFPDSNSSFSFFTTDMMMGVTPTLIIIDDAAGENIWNRLGAAPHARWLVMSTPNGSNWFYKIYTAARHGEGPFAPFYADFTEHPVYKQKEWMAQSREHMGEMTWRQEILQEPIDRQAERS